MTRILPMPSAHIKCLAALILTISVLAGCASSGPATSFYSFFPSDTIESQGSAGASFSLGVGPVVLPEYLENPAVVSLTEGQRLRVSGYHAWAGSLKEAITRVVAEDLSRAYPSARVDAFPWDNRVRPDFQLRLNFNEFAGIRGGQVTASIGWTLLNQRGDKIIASGKVDRKIATGSSDVEVYVKSLNQLLNSSVELIAAEIAGYLTS